MVTRAHAFCLGILIHNLKTVDTDEFIAI